MDHAAYYNQVSELYDTCVQADFDVPFFLEAAKQASGPVLELMAGSGRVSLPLIEAGIPLTCVDFSAGLLAILRRKLAGKQHAADLHMMDVRDLALKRTFKLIFIPFHAFPEVTNLADEQCVLQRVADHLADQGRFICTLHNPAIRLQSVNQPYSLWLKQLLPDEQGSVLLWGTQQYNPASELVTVHEFFEVYDSANVMQARHMVELTFRLLQPAQFETMAAQAGFEVEALYGNYDQTAFDEQTSPFMIWVLHKATKTATD